MGQGSNPPPTTSSIHTISHPVCLFYVPLTSTNPTTNTTNNKYTHSTHTHLGENKGTKRRLKVAPNGKRTLKTTASNSQQGDPDVHPPFDTTTTDDLKFGATGEPEQTARRDHHPRTAKKPTDFSYLRDLSIPIEHMRRREELLPFGTDNRASNLVLKGETTLLGVKGWGLFVGDRGFKEGDSIGLYSGERYPTAEKAFEAAHEQGTQNKIFEMPAKFKNRYVVPRRDECPGSLINDPLTQTAANCEIRTNLSTGKNVIIALKELVPCEELFTEYGPGCWDGQWDLADINEILGAYPELVESYLAYQETLWYDEEVALDDWSGAHSKSDSQDLGDLEGERDSDREMVLTVLSTPTGSGSSLSASHPPMISRPSTKGSLNAPRSDPRPPTPDLHGDIDTPLLDMGETTGDPDPHDLVMSMVTRLPPPGTERDEEEAPPSFPAVQARTARRYLSLWQLYIDYCASTSFRLDSWEGLSLPASLSHLKNYIRWLRDGGRNVKAAFTALRKGLSDRGHDVSILSSKAVTDAKKEGAPSQREKSLKAEERFRAAVPFEFVKNGLLSNWGMKSLYERLVSTASLLMYDRSKRVCTVAHTHPSELEGDEGHALLCEDIVLMDSAQHNTRYDPISYRREMMRCRRRAAEDPNSSIRFPIVDYFKAMFRGDKVPGETTVVIRRTSPEHGHGCPLEDTLLDHLLEICVIGEHVSRQDMFFSLPSASTGHPRKRLCSKDITAVLKAQARLFRLPAKYFASHSYRITGKTNATIANHACNHLPRAADINLMIGWTAQSTSAPRYVRPTYMGHSNLRQVSTGNPDHYVSLGDVILSLPMPAMGNAEVGDSESSSGSSVSSLSLDPPVPVTTTDSGVRPVRKAPPSEKKKPTDRAPKATPTPRKLGSSMTTSKMTTRGSSGRKKTVGFQRN